MALGKRRKHTRSASPLPAERENFAFAAEIPLGERAPLWKLQLQIDSTPQADGEHTRLRAHLQTNFASALRPALARAPDDRAALSHADAPRALRIAERAGHAVQNATRRALEVPLVRRLAEPLLQLDFNTWIEIRASTASLDAGSHSLLPQAERLEALGIRPKQAGDEPLAESWAGEAPDGFAQVSVLQLDRRHLPARLLRLLGERPFGLAATIVNTAQQK